MSKLIILDRDGVINYDSDAYIKSPEEWFPIPGSLEAIAKLKQAGYLVAVASKQSGIARGYFSEETLAKIHDKMQAALAQLGCQIDMIFYCPHGPDDHCNCRKPKPGLFQQIANHFNCSLTNVPAVGDAERDIEAALAVGCQPILVQSGKKFTTSGQKIKAHKILVLPDLLAVVNTLLRPSTQLFYS